MHECVVIPDFGALISRKKPSYYSEEQEKFFPPVSELAFNRNINKDDGLLAHHISVVLNIPFAEARETIRSKVKEIESLLRGSGEVTFGSLGRFILMGEGNIVFTPFTDSFTRPGYYGFPVLNVTQLDEYKKRAQIQAVVTRIPLGTAAIAASIALFIALNFIPLQVSRQSLVQQQKAYIQIQNKPLQYTAGSRDSIASLIDEMTQKENALAMTSTDEVVNETTADTVVAAEKKEPAPVIKEVIKQSTTVEKGYYLIAGSFVEMWRAEQFSKEMKEKGFEPVIVNSDNKLRIAIYHTAEKSEADNQLAATRNKYPEMPVWLLKK